MRYSNDVKAKINIFRIIAAIKSLQERNGGNRIISSLRQVFI